MSWESEAHRDWHTATGVPMGTPGCPQDACHLPEFHCVCGDYIAEDEVTCGEAACVAAYAAITLEREAREVDRLAEAADNPWEPPF